jgi:serine/threonine protein phosphatase PrpC
VTLRIRHYAKQAVGRRARQEDAYKIIERDDALLAVIADGLGGHPGGDVASMTAVEGLAAFIEERGEELAENPVATLVEAMHAIDEGLREMGRRHPQIEGLATTIALLYVTDTRVHRLSIGDSLIYRCVRARCWRWNELHETEAGYLTSCLGASFGDIDCPQRGTLLKSGDRFLLATDGIETVPEAKIGECLARASTPRQAVDGLFAAIRSAGYAYQDNTTMIALFAD